MTEDTSINTHTDAHQRDENGRRQMVRYAAVGIVAAIVASLIVLGGFLAFLAAKPEALAPLLNAANVHLSTQQQTAGETESRIVETVKKARPAVVAITVSKNVPVYELYEGRPSPFEDFFGEFFFRMPQLRQNGTELQEIGGGSGFLVSSDGYIVTNRHVVSDEEAQYTVLTNNGSSYPAQVIARDAILDIAILKIDGTGFDHLSFGDSEALEVGQTVIAIGNALGEFRNTVSVGVVSGLSRSIVASDRRGGTEALDQLIQTDAAINSGNSGGPLLNLQGEVIGVNVAVASGAQNVGFALSANGVKNIVESVKETGRIVRPYLGVRYVPVTPELQEELDLPVDYGALVGSANNADEPAVIPNSPADEAGIEEGDLILEVNGIQLKEDRSLASLVQEEQVGDTIQLQVYSDGEARTVSVTLEEMSL